MNTAFKPDVSVIVPVYNVEKYIYKSVKTILMQTHRNIEIILVDDGSRDSSGKICDEFAKHDARVKVIHKQNEGTGYARNSGMDAAEGEYLYFCDPDDFLEPNLIEDNYAMAKQNDADIVVFGFKTVWKKENGAAADRELTDIPKLGGRYSYEEYWNNLRQSGIMRGVVWNSLFKREYIYKNNVRHTNLKNGQDTYFIYEVYNHPFECIVYNQKPYYLHYKYSDSVTGVYQSKRADGEYAISRRFDELLKTCGHYSSCFDAMVCKCYVSGLYKTLENLARAGKSLSRSQKKAELKKYLSREKVRESLKNVSFDVYDSSTSKIKLLILKTLLLRLHLYGAAVAMAEIHLRTNS